MIIHKALHLKIEIDTMYMSEKKDGGDSIKDSFDESIKGINDFIKKQRLITTASNCIDHVK